MRKNYLPPALISNSFGAVSFLRQNPGSDRNAWPLKTERGMVGATGFEPSTDIDNQGVIGRDTQGDAQTSVNFLTPQSQVVNAWPRFSAPLKAAFLAIIATSTQ
jgi:hypothetical protein